MQKKHICVNKDLNVISLTNRVSQMGSPCVAEKQEENRAKRDNEHSTHDIERRETHRMIEREAEAFQLTAQTKKQGKKKRKSTREHMPVRE